MLSGAWKLHTKEGQNLGSHFESLHYDIQRHSMYLKEASLNELLQEHRIGPNYDDQESIKESMEIMRKFRFNKYKFGLLRKLLLKYLQLRRPLLELCQIENMVYIMGSIISMFGEENQDFDPQNLWKLMNYTDVLKSFLAFICPAMYFAVRNGYNAKHKVSTDTKSHVCLFGEFIYYVSTMNIDSNSPISEIRRHATEGEHLLMDEIAMSVSPKLGILIFIAFRNFASNRDNNIVENIFKNSQQYRRIYPIIHNSYSVSVKNLRQIPVLNDYFDAFLNYLCTKINQFSNRFRERTLSVKKLKHLEDDGRILKGDIWCNKGSLVLILLSVTDILIFLHNEGSDLNCKGVCDLSKYLEKYFRTKSIDQDNSKLFKYKGTYGSVWAMLLAMSLLLDFVFIQNWQLDIGNYVIVCNKIKAFIDAQGRGLKEFAREHSLFPFV